MKIKKFTGKSLKDVTEQMREELGDGAIILNTKNISNADAKDTYEITAAIDEEVNVKKLSPAKLKAKSVGYDLNPIENLRRIAAQFERSRDTRKVSSLAEMKEFKGISEIKTELDTVKGTLGEIAQHLKTIKIPTLPKTLQSAYEAMINNEIDQKIASDIILDIFNNLGPELIENNSLIDELINSKIAECIITAEPLKVDQKQSKVIAFIGPTGVGKTTTICKIAAVCKFFNHYNVSIISADTYRIAAIDQLRTFTNIANIFLDVAYTPDEMKDLIKKHSDKDIIFIDTVGRSQKQNEHLKDLKKFINAATPNEVHLIISAPVSFMNMKDIVKRFGTLMPNRLIISKIDETVHMGAILNIIHHSRIPLSYITNGQVIPDDLAVPDPIKLAGMIYKEIDYDY